MRLHFCRPHRAVFNGASVDGDNLLLIVSPSFGDSRQCLAVLRRSAPRDRQSKAFKLRHRNVACRRERVLLLMSQSAVVFDERNGTEDDGVEDVDHADDKEDVAETATPVVHRSWR